MTTFEWDAPDELQTSNYCRSPGTYHMIITSVENNPTGKSGAMIDGFKVHLSIAAGTTPDQEDKLVELTFFNPKLNAKDGGAFARQKQFRFFLASNVLKIGDLGRRSIKIDLDKAIGSQVVATLDVRDEKYLDLNYADIWHVDDPEANAFPKSDLAIKQLPADKRAEPSSFKPSKDAKKPQPAASAAASSGGASLDDL